MSNLELKVYADRMSQPSRAILIFCKMNGIQFQEIKIDLSKEEHKSSEYKEINPMGQVPAIVHGSVKLFERTAKRFKESDIVHDSTQTVHFRLSEIWEALQKKYETEKVGTKKYDVSRYMKYQMIDDKFVEARSHEL